MLNSIGVYATLTAALLGESDSELRQMGRRFISSIFFPRLKWVTRARSQALRCFKATLTAARCLHPWFCTACASGAGQWQEVQPWPGRSCVRAPDISHDVLPQNCKTKNCITSKNAVKVSLNKDWATLISSLFSLQKKLVLLHRNYKQNEGWATLTAALFLNRSKRNCSYILAEVDNFIWLSWRL